MAEKIASLYAEISADTKKFKQALGDVKKDTSDAANKIDLFSKGSIKAFAAVGGAVAATALVFKDIVDDTMKYAFAVDDLSRALGTSAEESSKLIQVADDLRIPVEALKMGFKKALQEGVAPNIEGLKGLAKQYQALKSPIEKSQFAIKYFGRSALELNKILQLTPRQLDEMAKSAEEAGLVLGTKDVQATEALYGEIDNLNDSMEGLKITIGKEAIPVLAEFTGWLNEAIKSGDLANAVYERMFVVQEELATGIPHVSLEWHDLVPVTKDAAQATEEAGQAAEYSWGKFYALADAIRAGASAADETKPKLQHLLDGLDWDPTAALEEFGKNMVWMASGGGELNIAAKKVAELVDAGLIPPEAGKQMTDKILVAMVDLQEETGLIDWQTATDKLSEAFGISAKDAAEWLKGTEGPEQALTAITSQPWYVDIYYREHNKPFAPGARPSGGSDHGIDEGTGGASGLSMIVPPGFSNDSYYVRASSGESVNISPSGQGGGGDVYVVQNFYDQGAAALGMAYVDTLRGQRLDASMGR